RLQTAHQPSGRQRGKNVVDRLNRDAAEPLQHRLPNLISRDMAIGIVERFQHREAGRGDPQASLSESLLIVRADGHDQNLVTILEPVKKLSGSSQRLRHTGTSSPGRSETMTAGTAWTAAARALDGGTWRVSALGEGWYPVPHRFPALLAAPAAGADRLWVTRARLFDGTGRPVREDAAILVQDGIIRRVTDASEQSPDGARVVDIGRRALMPGLIDAHTHAAGCVPAVRRGAEDPLPGVAAHFLQAELRDYLRRGVTTIRVTGSQGLAPQAARQAMRYGAFRGPRLLTCGKIISATAPGGRFYGDMYREADGPDEMRRAVREQIRAGADFIKVMTTGARSNELEDPGPLQLTEAELSAVTGEARRMGFLVSAHAEGLDGCAAAIGHGADTIEHGMYLHQRPDLLKAMAAAGQVLVPTLSGYYWMAGLGEVVDPSLAQPVPHIPPRL